MSMVRFLNEIKEPKVSELGGKGYSLAALMNNGFNVPKGFVITSEAFFKFLKENKLMETIERLTSELNEENFQEKSREIRDLTLKGKVPEEIVSEIKEALNKLNVEHVSIRSSAVSEDSLKASFAGLHDTFLNVETRSNLVLEFTKKCWASLFSERAIAYRVKKNLLLLEGMAVVVQEMIPAEISGTTFTAHPDTTDRNIMVIESSWGLGESIVSGKITPDRYIIKKDNLTIVSKILGNKKTVTIPSKNGVVQAKTPEAKKNMFSLDDVQIINLASICLKIEKIYNYPQDIEWCLHKNKIWILQSRSITSLEVKT